MGDIMQTKSTTVIYKLTIADLHNVASEVIDRKLTQEEINHLIEKIGDYIDWFGAIETAIIQHIK